MFYLRKQTLRAKCATGFHTITVHVYWNYRLTIQGVLRVNSRKVAKQLIIANNPEAEFFR